MGREVLRFAALTQDSYPSSDTRFAAGGNLCRPFPLPQELAVAPAAPRIVNAAGDADFVQGMAAGSGGLKNTTQLLQSSCIGIHNEQGAVKGRKIWAQL